MICCVCCVGVTLIVCLLITLRYVEFVDVVCYCLLRLFSLLVLRLRTLIDYPRAFAHTTHIAYARLLGGVRFTFTLRFAGLIVPVVVADCAVVRPPTRTLVVYVALPFCCYVVAFVTLR